MDAPNASTPLAGKIELRIGRDQIDMLIYACSLARDQAVSDKYRTQFVGLRNWLRIRRIKRWGDEVADAVNRVVAGSEPLF
jgi:hypothetical protein